MSGFILSSGGTDFPTQKKQGQKDKTSCAPCIHCNGDPCSGEYRARARVTQFDLYVQVPYIDS